MRRPVRPSGMPFATVKGKSARNQDCVPERVTTGVAMVEFWVGVLFCTGVGYVIAGIGASGYSLFAEQSLSFDAAETSSPGILPHVLLILLTGPMLMVRQIVAAAANGDVNPVRLLTSTLVATTWSFCTGLAILNLGVALTG